MLVLANVYSQEIPGFLPCNRICREIFGIFFFFKKKVGRRLKKDSESLKEDELNKTHTKYMDTQHACERNFMERKDYQSNS